MRKLNSLLLLLFAAMMSWTSAFAQTSDEYEAALASITDGGVYYVKANGFYLKADGTMTASKEDASEYIFKKVPGSFQKYGFLLDCNGSFFSNPPGTNESNLKSGKISTSTRGDYEYEAQVFFLKDGKYAVRAGNTATATSGWAWVAGSYWTAIAEAESAIAEYQWEPNYVWELEVDETKTKQSVAFDVLQTWPFKIQTASGLVKDAVAQYYSNAKQSNEGTYEALLDGDYSTYFHSNWSGGPAEDHYLQAKLDEPIQKYQFYYKKRHNNNNNRPTSIVISASNDGTNFTEITTINEGLPTDASVLDYVSDVIDLGAEYKYVRYTITNTNNGAKSNDHYFFTFSEFYMLPQYSVFEEALSFYKKGHARFDLSSEDIEAINRINKDIENAVMEVTYQVKFNNEVVATKILKVLPNSKPNMPADLKGVFLTFSDPDVSVITKENNVVTYVATWDGPFQLSASEADAKWYNMTIRSDYSVFVGAEEPYYPKTATNIQKIADEYQWAFAGNPYTGIVVCNKAKGIKYSLTKDGDAAVMREGMYLWTIGKNADGFTLKETGTANNCINQAGGASGPLKFWDNGNSPTDNGSTFRISAVPTSFEWTIGDAGYATMYLPFNVNVEGNPTIPTAIGTWTFDNGSTDGTGIATLSATEGVTFADGAAVVPADDYLKMTTNANGDLNTYTFMMDVKIANENKGKYTALYQNKPANDGDGSLFFLNDNNKGRGVGLNYCDMGYGANGNVELDKMYRVVFVCEDGVGAVYLNGVLAAKATKSCTTYTGKNNHWTMRDVALFFVDNDGEDNDIVCDELRFWDVALTADQVAELGATGTSIPELNNVEASVATLNGEYMKLNEIGAIVPAATPVVLKAKPGTYNFCVDKSLLNCAKAVEKTTALADNTITEEDYSVVGYITNTDGKISRDQQVFWMADETDGGKVFEAYWANIPDPKTPLKVGQKVIITGKLQKYVNKSGAVTCEIKNPSVAVIDNDLRGTYEEIDAAGQYVLAKPEGKEVGFYRAASGKIAANKAFLTLFLEEGTEAREAFLFNAPEGATAIESLTPAITEGEVIYNIAGQRVNKAQKGIYIVNGKKVLF